MFPAPAAPAAVDRAAGRELVLVLPRARAMPAGSWHGLRLQGVSELLSAVAEWGEFRPRSEVEKQPEWQQLIPHLVVVAGDRVLAMRRLQGGSERRLRGQVTLGVGGHVNLGDGPLAEAWERGCRREWLEEVVCDRPLPGRALGLIKDDAGEVGRVHLGVLILVDAGDGTVDVREHHKLQGEMTRLSELGASYLEMETWSQFVYDALLEGRLGSAPGLEMTLPSVASELDLA